MRFVTIRCECCDLAQRVKDRPGKPSTVCATCGEHRGNDEVSLRRRAESHLQMVTVHLAAARGGADDAYRDRDSYKEKMHAAYRSREQAVRVLQRLAELHQPLGRGVCSCRARGCPSMAILDRPWVRDRLRQLEQVDAQREAELWAIDARDEWSVMAWDRPIGESPGAGRSVG